MARMKRDEAVRVKLDAAVKERLQRLAEMVGIPAGTLASLAVGLYVTQQERSLALSERFIDGMAVSMGEGIAQQLKQILQSFEGEVEGE
jgi:tetrahydromethanopterin S-methyltransferase subunit G